MARRPRLGVCRGLLNGAERSRSTIRKLHFFSRFLHAGFLAVPRMGFAIRSGCLGAEPPAAARPLPSARVNKDGGRQLRADCRGTSCRYGLSPLGTGYALRGDRVEPRTGQSGVLTLVVSSRSRDPGARMTRPSRIGKRSIMPCITHVGDEPRSFARATWIGRGRDSGQDAGDAWTSRGAQSLGSAPGDGGVRGTGFGPVSFVRGTGFEPVSCASLRQARGRTIARVPAIFLREEAGESAWSSVLRPPGLRKPAGLAKLAIRGEIWPRTGGCQSLAEEMPGGATRAFQDPMRVCRMRRGALVRCRCVRSACRESGRAPAGGGRVARDLSRGGGRPIMIAAR